MVEEQTCYKRRVREQSCCSLFRQSGAKTARCLALLLRSSMQISVNIGEPAMVVVFGKLQGAAGGNTPSSLLCQAISPAVFNQPRPMKRLDCRALCCTSPDKKGRATSGSTLRSTRTAGYFWHDCAHSGSGMHAHSPNCLLVCISRIETCAREPAHETMNELVTKMSAHIVFHS